MYKSSGSQFYETTQWNKIMTRCFWQIKVSNDFLNALWITEILCSFRLVLQGKIDQKIPELSILESLEKLVSKNFALSDAEGNISGSLNTRDIADLTLLRKISAIQQPKVLRAKFLGKCSFVLLAYPSLTASRTFLQSLLACLNITLDLQDFFLLVQIKRVICMSYRSSISSWKSWR